MHEEELQHLDEALERLWELARRFRLDPFPTHFEVVPASIMYEFGAYGIPGRFNHWTRGKAYHVMKTQYDFGLARIYELVVNTNPTQAFLLDNNSLVTNKFVAAHVLAHSDFFKNNIHFQATSRDMVDRAGLNADRIRRYELEHGSREVEAFLDACLSIEAHVEPEGRSIEVVPARRPQKEAAAAIEGRPFQHHGDYEELWEDEGEKTEQEKKRPPIPAEPTRDLLQFLIQEAPYLEDWQRDILTIVREERLYFYPQAMTKIMNEGWASFWHLRMMREMELTDEEYTDFARLHASVLAPPRGSINPYHVGLKIWEDIEKRWGEEGREKIFEVRATEDDVSFLRNYLTEELVEELDLYLFELQDDQWEVTSKDWEAVRDNLVQSRIYGGHPVILVEDGDYNRNRELYLRHSYEGRELDLKYAQRTLENVYRLWGRPVHLETVVDGEQHVLSVTSLGEEEE